MEKLAKMKERLLPGTRWEMDAYNPLLYNIPYDQDNYTIITILEVSEKSFLVKALNGKVMKIDWPKEEDIRICWDDDQQMYFQDKSIAIGRLYKRFILAYSQFPF